MVRITFIGVLAAVGLALTGCTFFGEREEPVDFWQPALSPDGTVLAYIAKGEKSYALFLLNLA
ncbi:MAG: hypothetical protein N2320_06315, partial [Candidatus Bipolaricaulota bacterium]|nr:hypothetical protein [Candidatus Bipolaricaulota bacterium]